MDKLKIRKINRRAANIYLIVQRLKNTNKKKDEVNYDEKLKNVLNRGIEYARKKNERSVYYE